VTKFILNSTAVLITESRTATLKDIEGKELSRSTGYKCSDLSSLIEGSTLIIGSKEIEVMQVLSADDYKTGKCFITGITTQYSNPVKPKPKIGKCVYQICQIWPWEVTFYLQLFLIPFLTL
jgi:hypothetical protein